MPANLSSNTAPSTLYVRLDDTDALRDWVTAHDLRHRMYSKLSSQLGYAVQPTLLGGKVDQDWFHRHTMAHLALSQLFPGQLVGLTPALAVTKWRDETAFEDWMHRHALIHARLDAAFGIH